MGESVVLSVSLEAGEDPVRTASPTVARRALEDFLFPEKWTVGMPRRRA